ncbi:MAG: hypothetical protein MHM6MM_005555 [Cercozoa sp. M6MM]
MRLLWHNNSPNNASSAKESSNNHNTNVNDESNKFIGTSDCVVVDQTVNVPSYVHRDGHEARRSSQPLSRSSTYRLSDNDCPISSEDASRSVDSKPKRGRTKTRSTRGIKLLMLSRSLA